MAWTFLVVYMVISGGQPGPLVRLTMPTYATEAACQQAYQAYVFVPPAGKSAARIHWPKYPCYKTPK